MNQTATAQIVEKKMKRWSEFIVLILFLFVGAAACARDEGETSPVEVEGPALVMFYTDD